MFTLDFCERTFCSELDYEVLASIKKYIPSNNVYFLLCMAETVSRETQKAKECGVDIQIMNEDVWDKLKDKANEVYNSVNLSSLLDDYFE